VRPRARAGTGACPYEPGAYLMRDVLVPGIEGGAGKSAGGSASKGKTLYFGG